ncbi:UDP-N-acetylglucosamine--N-acetylmuramyl-(pentapeptide) pyrophosphoryl-undecaprenol N-acetylglucosamine transferase [Chondrocystis sp. NIES-4102]|nr:UDP-N-acetylglucosamine--N-acetylmuramyl-(pentapeptide) pyrophosphoryl-undecaprenol N-acetylglucosamine transferase [Chondrocystis sp. NIES-4102]
MEKKILLTGGGSAGHITVNLALIPMLLEAGWEVIYIGSITGIERELIGSLTNVTYYPIATGKLRRYFDWQNFTDVFRVLTGITDAYKIIRREQPNIVFSKGGFVSVPVVLASRLNNIPVITHESDLTPGLANRINMNFAQKICTTFPETLKYLPKDKGEYIGAIVRPELKLGDRSRGRIFCQFESDKPVILVTGGSLGSVYINQVVRSLLTQLLINFQVVHICGKGNLDRSLEFPGYKQLEYVGIELRDLMCLADLVISRAGSNFIFEFLALKKPMILIPLPKKSSRGDQIDNANTFKRQGFAEVILEENLTSQSLLSTINQVYEHREDYINNMASYNSDCSLSRLFELITQNFTQV